MKRKIALRILALFSSLLMSKEMSFNELTKMASEDLGKNIYLDKGLKDYKVDINLAEYQKRGQLYEFFKIALMDNDFAMVYNKNGDFYYIKDKKTQKTLPEPALQPKSQRLHYYTYKIRNITNKDVVGALEVFNKVKFKHLKQSDIIAYSCTLAEHKEIVRILKKADNKVVSRRIKITIFSVNKKKVKDMGTQIKSFGFGVSSTVIDSLFSSLSDVFNFKSSFNINAYMQFLKNWGVTTIQQAPTILVTNGIETEINSVANIRYVVGNSSQNTQGTNTVQEEYKYKDVGLKIKLLPKIKHNWVWLDLELVSEELISFEKDNPTIGKVSYKSSFKVVKGKPLLLTGINKTSLKEDSSSVPFLSSMPILGFLFKGKSIVKEEQNINILIEVL